MGKKACQISITTHLAPPVTKTRQQDEVEIITA